MTTQEFLVQRAKDMLRNDKRLWQDAMQGVHVGNTAAGCLLAAQYAAPRWASEAAVARALAALDADETDEEQDGDDPRDRAIII